MKKLYIHTIGCQMNVYDSIQIAGQLADLGYEPGPAPETADLIIANTCSVREKAEQKAFSFLGRLADLKKKNPKVLVAVGGCVAQQEGVRILRRMAHVDLVFGTQAIPRLADLVRRIETQGGRLVDTQATEDADQFPAEAVGTELAPVGRFVTIMRGCDNYCTYCVVPHVRGREKSRRPEGILREIKALARRGVREVTLLGQNVNSYGKKENWCRFSDLLEMINEVAGLKRIRFTTSHPKDLSEDIIEKFGSLDKLCRHIHLPVQSGSDRILKRMNRKYDTAAYLEKVRMLKSACPDIAVTSDFIVGFPGETPSDFEQTLEVMDSVRFDASFAFKYSDRPAAPATGFSQKVEEAVKNERLQRLLALQERITLQKNRELVGTVQTVLLEGPSKKNHSVSAEAPADALQWTGRTSHNRIVNFLLDQRRAGAGNGGGCAAGQLMKIKITDAYQHSLWGEMNATAPNTSKGGMTHAA